MTRTNVPSAKEESVIMRTSDAMFITTLEGKLIRNEQRLCKADRYVRENEVSKSNQEQRTHVRKEGPWKSHIITSRSKHKTTRSTISDNRDFIVRLPKSVNLTEKECRGISGAFRHPLNRETWI